MSSTQIETESTPVNPIATVTSAGAPQPGQSHRSSGNFSLENAPPGTTRIQWFVTDNSNGSQITFDVMEDKSLWPDPTIWSGLRNGSVTSLKTSRSFYIANPANTGGNTFSVQIWPYSG
jgi:hypothetical protein